MLAQLLELYRCELSGLDGRTPDRRGRFGYPRLPTYWKETGRHPYLIRANGQLAGFALVNKWSPLEGCDWSVAEFFVLPAFRKKQVGERAAAILFARHTGTWHVAEMRKNRQALAFWRKVIGRFTGRRFKEVDVKTAHWDGRVQVFIST